MELSMSKLVIIVLLIIIAVIVIIIMSLGVNPSKVMISNLTNASNTTVSGVFQK